MDHAGADTKFGYHIKPTDKMAFIVDLMNMNMDDKVSRTCPRPQEERSLPQLGCLHDDDIRLCRRAAP